MGMLERQGEFFEKNPLVPFVVSSCGRVSCHMPRACVHQDPLVPSRVMR